MKVDNAGSIMYQRKKRKLKDETEKRKKEIRKDFEKYLREETERFGYNPYQE